MAARIPEILSSVNTVLCFNFSRVVSRAGIYRSPSTDLLRIRHSTNFASPAENIKPYSEIPSAGNPIVQGIRSAVMFRNKFYQYEMELHKRHGAIFRLKLFNNKELVAVSNASAIETIVQNEGRFPRRGSIPVWNQVIKDINMSQGLFTASDEQWYKLRKAVEKPLLRTEDVYKYADGLNRVTFDLVEKLGQLRDDANVVRNVEKQLFKWSLEAVGSILFDRRLGCFSENRDPELEKFILKIQRHLDLTRKLSIAPSPKMAKMLFPGTWADYLKNSKFCYSVGDKYARAHQDSDTGLIGHVLKHRHLSRKDVAALISEIFAAGVDTTANVIQWSIYELSRHPEIQEKLHREIVSVFPAGGFPTLQNLQAMPLLRGIVKETMRLYPLSIITRIIPEDVVLMGYRIPAKTPVAIFLPVIGRMGEIFPDPLSFHPERWLRDTTSNQTNAERAFSSLYFGFGARSCVGRRLAELEMHLLIAQLFGRFKVEPKFTGQIDIIDRIVLAPSKSINIKLTERN